MAQLFANAARSTLTASITAAANQLQINPADQGFFPVATGLDWFKVAVEDSNGNLEFMRVQRAVGQSILTITARATEDASTFPARTFVAGSLVELRMTAADLAATLGHPAETNGAHIAQAITFSPAGSIAATNIQSAIQELDAEKASVASIANMATTGANTFTGVQTLAANAVNALEAVPKQQMDAAIASTRALAATTNATSTLTAEDKGAMVFTNAALTVPAGVFAARDVVTVYNNGSTAIPLNQGAGFTLRIAGTTATGPRTVAALGLCTIVFVSATEAVVTGAGVS